MDEHKDGLDWALSITIFCYIFIFLHQPKL